MTPSADDPPRSVGSVIVPAHNEASRGFPVLAVLRDAVTRLGVEAIVVCNGCTDGTVDLARTAAGVQVVELAEASKAAALNEGDRVAGSVFPRLYLDADIEITVDGIARLLDVLRDDQALIAAPSAAFLVDGAPWLVRAYYEAMGEIPFLVNMRASHLDGRGAYGLSERGRSRFASFPPLLADDVFVDRMFEVGEKRTVDAVVAGVPVPERLATFLRAKTRTAVGSYELARWLATERPDRLVVSDAQPDPTSPLTRRVRHHLRHGGLLASPGWRSLTRLGVYLSIEGLTRVVAIGRGVLDRRGPWR